MSHSGALVVSLAVLAGCLESGTHVCSSGLICPADSMCSEDGLSCISPTVCGDGVRNGGEQCDGDDLALATCTSEGFYQETTGLACADDCQFDTAGCSGICGDGVLEGPETCEDPGSAAGACLYAGFEAGLLTCSSSCGVLNGECIHLGWTADFTGVGDQLISMWGHGNELVAVTNTGKLRRFTGLAWTEMESPLENGADVWGSSLDDLWLLEDGARFHHWNGAAWELVLETESYDQGKLWGSGPDDVFAAMASGAIWHYDGTDWTETIVFIGTTWRSIWGSGPGDVFVVGNAGTIAHHDGRSWDPMTSNTGQPLVSVWGSGPDDVYAGGVDVDSFLLHYDGDEWTEALRLPNSEVRAIGGTGPKDVHVTVLGSLQGILGASMHFDGRAWTGIPLDALVDDLVATPGGMVGTGGSGMAHRFAGAAWTEPDAAPSVDYSDAWAADAGAYVAVGASADGGRALHVDGTERLVFTSVGPIELSAVWGAAPDDVFAAAGDGAIHHFDGDGWVEEQPAAEFSTPLRAIWGSGPDDVYAVGDEGLVLHRSGGTWNDPQAPVGNSYLIDVWGSGPDDVYLVDGAGHLFHWNGQDWTDLDLFDEVPSEAIGLASIWGTGPDDVWVVAYINVLFHFDGTAWSAETVVGPAEYDRIDGTGPDDIFLIDSTEPHVAHFDGRGWAPVAPPPSGIGDVLVVTPTRILVGSSLRSLIRTRHWPCLTAEMVCNDAVDDDCDGAIDGLDSDC